MGANAGGGHGLRWTPRRHSCRGLPDYEHGVAFGRTPGEILNIVYLTPGQASSGGFYPSGLNGDLTTSGAAGT